MRTIDLIGMALRNLRARPVRSALNALGILLGSQIVLMTLAGTRGAADSLLALVGQAEGMRRIVVMASDAGIEPPAEAIAVDGEQDESRRQAIEQRLRDEWLSSNAVYAPVSAEQLAMMRGLPHVVEVVPERRLSVEFRRGETTWTTFVDSVADSSRQLEEQLIVGRLPRPGATDEVLLSEYAAYRLGGTTRREAELLLGRSFDVRFRREGVPAAGLSHLLYRTGAQVTTDDEALLAESVARLIDRLPEASLSESQRAMLEAIFAPAESESSAATDEPKAPIEPYFERRLTVCGIVELGDDAPGFLQFLTRTAPDVGMNHRGMEPLSEQAEQLVPFRTCFVQVDSIANLAATVRSLEEAGLQVYSNTWLIDDIDRQIGIARWGVIGVASIVLLVTALAISNTLVISVLQRIPEFGIMKSIGASNRQILGMMLFEGGCLGALGAIGAMLLSWPIASVIEGQVQAYIAYRIGSPFDGAVFRTEVGDHLSVIVIALAIGVAASLLPAIRAARLDPIDAMKGG
ncbi:MAG TPA: hypothetical protein DCQ98_11830 [Planctomycetaceae bacterium]|nr:hypothetical protein [Planctomycetaceae bacterium]HRE99338.1 ABC transporter permease [Pirellulaceae bacterium]